MSWNFDELQPQAHDIWASFSLLTRLPVPVDHVRAGARGASAAWAFPVVGIVVGALAGCIAVIAGWFGVPAGISAAIALAVLAMSTGGMHEDGLADLADGMGGLDRERRLEIMKDSRIGAYGVIALIIALLARWSGIAELSGWTLIFTLSAVGASSRAIMVVMMHLMPNARENGLSAGVGKPKKVGALTAVGIALAACVLLTGLSGVVLCVVSFAGVIPVYLIANRALGGQTGDVLGAGQQCAEIAGLAAAIALLS